MNGGGFIVMQWLHHICFSLLDLSTSTTAEVYPRELWCLRNLPHHDGVKMNCSFIFIHDSLLVSLLSEVLKMDVIVVFFLKAFIFREHTIEWIKFEEKSLDAYALSI